MKEKLIEKLEIRLKYQNLNRDTNEDLLGLYIDNAVDEICEWRNLSNNDEVLSGRWDNAIMEFVVESLVYNGSEGKSYETTSGITNQYLGTPIDGLHTRVDQRAR